MAGLTQPPVRLVLPYISARCVSLVNLQSAKGISPFVSAPLVKKNDGLTGDAARCHRTSTCYNFTSERDARE